ncbi:glycoside hydrolase family 23 protein [Suillus luteus UH-Slu-Lm8-n1]|uniref:Glycoside hydrolase family 23 protein n=1 Tax=Suillus luteus UH-Slu-Lm8-n1 TaxID=930992 RepID=A0A0D0A3L5_9AGAM|nr:glycoside hydrolase family 23 protein [Suillus luteus UH-Slu-Lm8-n1]
MKLTVSLLAVLVTVAVVVQAGHSFKMLPAQRAALDRHAALSARNKIGDSTPKLRRTCKPRPPVSSGSPAPSVPAPSAGPPSASASEQTTLSTTTSTLTVFATSSPTLTFPVASELTTISTITSTMTVLASSSPTPTFPAASELTTISTSSSTLTVLATSSPIPILPVPSSPTPTSSATSSIPQPPKPGNGTSNNSGGGPNGGLVKVVSSKGCGSSGATKEITALSGPNGHIDFLTCGINEGGWKPPLIKIESIVTVDLSTVAYQDGSAFANCKDFVPTFEKYGSKYGIPAILLASFAMEESSCKPSTIGGAGEQGLMQLTSDKCVGAPNGDCKDVDFNIGAGAKFFTQLLKENDGDLLSCIGHYNGWFQGMTYADATAAAHGGNCREQNNLDYLHQFLNGWCQNINAYQHNPPLGKYFNLNVCN